MCVCLCVCVYVCIYIYIYHIRASVYRVYVEGMTCYLNVISMFNHSNCSVV